VWDLAEVEAWVRNIATFTPEIVEFESFTAVSAWLQRGLARPAVQRGLNIPKKPT
jgi:GST-like protein